MPRFYITDFVGDGLTTETAWRPRVLTLQDSPLIAVIEGRAVGNTNGPCLVYTDNTDLEHDSVRAHQNITYIPLENSSGDILLLTDTVGNIDPAKKANIINFMESKHIPTQGITNLSTIKEAMETVVRRFMLRGYLRELDPIEGLDTQISDIPVSTMQAIASKLQSLGFDTAGISGTVREGIKFLMDQDVRGMGFSL